MERKLSSARKENAECSWRLGLDRVERNPMQGKEVTGGPVLPSQASLPAGALPHTAGGPQGGDRLQDGAHLARWSRLSQEDMAKESRASASFQKWKRMQSRAAFLKLTALPVHHMEGGRPLPFGAPPAPPPQAHL